MTAERQWLDSGLPTHVFRLPGIYGPGRSMFDRIRSGSARRVNKPGLVFNRIHVADIASALSASMQRVPKPGFIANVVDDRPAPPQDVTVEGYRLLGWKRAPAEVPFEQAGLTGMAAEFYRDSKRCSNARLKAALGMAAGLIRPSRKGSPTAFRPSVTSAEPSKRPWCGPAGPSRRVRTAGGHRP